TMRNLFHYRTIGRDPRELHRGRSLCREYSGTVKPENNHKQKLEDQLSVPTQGLRLQAIFLIQGEAGGISSNGFVRIQADLYIASEAVISFFLVVTDSRV